ncbi:LysM peptidoglycan-binding domain-containing protein [Rubritalea spongiae]|uniref:LysM peptidoglycan-binding domain-containing protein n=1 Tax=Rubritalea spongiae TaxID=430797 RepID=A0ABW5E5Z8_9BACT
MPSFNPLALILCSSTATLSLFLSSCGHQPGGTIEVYETAGYQPNFGPFDSNGNYIDNWADNPPKRKYISRSKQKSNPPAQKPQQYAATTPTPPPTSAPISNTPPPPKKTPSVTVKPKTKPPLSHTVKRGDTLYGLSRKYGTSVSSIQRANNLRGTTIGLGQRLVIPR